MNSLLETERLRISSLSPSDLEGLADFLTKDALYNVIGDPPLDRSAAVARATRWARGSPSNDMIWANSVVCHRDATEIVGLCQATLTLNSAGQVTDCALAYLVDPVQHSQGIGGEMMRAFLLDIRNTYAPQRVSAFIAPGHLPSERLACSLGLSPSGQVDHDGEQLWTSA